SFSTEPATTARFALSLHDALPIYAHQRIAALQLQAVLQLFQVKPLDPLELSQQRAGHRVERGHQVPHLVGAASHRMTGIAHRQLDRKSTRLNSSHVKISYAGFCLKKKTRRTHPRTVLLPYGPTPCVLDGRAISPAKRLGRCAPS